MDKKVLAIYYTQSGQMGDIISSFTAPIAEAGATVEKVQVQPVTEYKFPWKGNHFFSVMPDCVLSVPTALQDKPCRANFYALKCNFDISSYFTQMA